MEEINNTEPLAGEDGALSSDGGVNDSPLGEETIELKDLLSKTLKRDFTTNESALKAVKDTFDYVGKAGRATKLIEKFGGEQKLTEYLTKMETNTQVEPQAEKPQVEQPKQDYISKDEFNKAMFYKDHPDLESYQEIIEALAVNKPRSEVLNHPTLKTLLDAKRAQDELEHSRSVLVSNPKIGQVKDKMADAREAASKGNFTAAKSTATQAVLEAYDLI